MAANLARPHGFENGERERVSAQRSDTTGAPVVPTRCPSRRNDARRWRCGGRPLEQEAQDQHKADVLGMADPCIGAGNGQPTVALGVIKDVPRVGQQQEAPGEEDVAGDVENSEVWVSFLAQQRRLQVPRVVRQDVHPRIAGLQPPGEQVDGQREAIHLDEQRHDKGGEGVCSASNHHSREKRQRPLGDPRL